MAAAPQVFQVGERRVTYGQRYGFNRKERANRIANNRPPAGIAKPPVGYVEGPTWSAYFTEKFRYVEDVFQLSKVEMEARTFIIVRSQKWGEIRNGRRYRQYYFITFKNGRTLFDALYKNFSLESCSCDDTQRCKHMMAVTKKYVRSPLRRLLTKL